MKSIIDMERNSSEFLKERSVQMELADILRPLTATFPAIHTMVKKQLAATKNNTYAVKNAMEADFKQYLDYYHRIPNNQCERDLLCDKLDKFLQSNPGWEYEVNEAKDRVLKCTDGLRDESLSNSLDKLERLYKSDESDNIRNVISEYKDRLQKLTGAQNGTFDNSDNPLIFDQKILQVFHAEYNDIWKDTDLTTFLDWFRVKPVGTLPKDINKSAFCRALGIIDEQRNKKLCSNIAEWIKYHIGGSNYSKMKNSGNPE